MSSLETSRPRDDESISDLLIDMIIVPKML